MCLFGEGFILFLVIVVFILESLFFVFLVLINFLARLFMPLIFMGFRQLKLNLFIVRLLITEIGAQM